MIRDRKNIFENPGPCNIAMSFIFWIIDELIGRSTKEIDIYNIFSTDIYSSLRGHSTVL